MNFQAALKKVARFPKKISLKYFVVVCVLAAVFLGSIVFQQRSLQEIQNTNVRVNSELIDVQEKLTQTETALQILENEDQKVRNDELAEHLSQLKEVYTEAVTEYERILDVKDNAKSVADQEALFAETLSSLSDDNYEEATQKLEALKQSTTALVAQLAAESQLKIPQAPSSNEAPGSGYSRQSVTTDIGSYTVSMVAGDLSSTRVIVDTASGSDCGNDCPVLPLSDFVSRNGGYAGINGTYFCPASYPSCAGKTNSFDLLVMNKDKTYFNSDNNVYSTNPIVIFLDGSIRFIGAASGWGRDTSPSGVLSNYPLLLSNNEIRFAGDGDPKKGSKGNRSFVANKGNIVYIGVVHGATVAESAIALKALGMENALNLDSGGSTALWSGGYKVGPGRNIPNAIVFVRK